MTQTRLLTYRIASTTGTLTEGDQVQFTDLNRTVYISQNGDNANSGTALSRPVQTFQQAFSTIEALTGNEDKGILCLDASTYNENLMLNTSNLIIDASLAHVNNIEFSAGNINNKIFLQSADNVTMRPNNYIDIDKISGDVTFVAGANTMTYLKIRELESTASINFTGATGTIHVEIEKTSQAVSAILATIPGTLKLSGYIGDTFFGGFNQERIPISSNITITSANLDTYNKKLLYTPIGVTGEITITISENINIDYFDVYLVGNHPVRIITQGADRINGEMDIRFTNLEGGKIIKVDSTNYGLIYDNTDPDMTDDYIDDARLSGTDLILENVNSSIGDITVDLSSLVGSGTSPFLDDVIVYTDSGNISLPNVDHKLLVIPITATGITLTDTSIADSANFAIYNSKTSSLTFDLASSGYTYSGLATGTTYNISSNSIVIFYVDGTNIYPIATMDSFLEEVDELDTGVQENVILNAQTEVLFWFTPALFTTAPSVTPTTDPSNPRPGQTESYSGGRDITTDGVFEDDAEISGQILYVALSPTYYTANQEDIRIRLDNSNGSQHFDFSLQDDFEEATTLDDATFKYFYLSPSGGAGLPIGYGADQQLYAYIGSQKKTFRLSSNVDLTHNLRNVGEINFDQDTKAKLNRQTTLDSDDRQKLDNITEQTSVGDSAVLTTFMFKTGGASVDTSEYQNGRFLIPGFTTTVTYTVVVPDTTVITGHQVVGGGSIVTTITEISPSLIVGKNMYTVRITNGSSLIELLGGETEITQFDLEDLYQIRELNLNDAITQKLDHTYTLPLFLKTLNASGSVSYNNDANYLSINPYIHNANSFVITKDTPANGTTLTSDVLTSFNQINNSNVTMTFRGHPYATGLLIPDANGNGGIGQYSIPFTGSGIFGGYVDAVLPDANNYNVLISAWINSNKMQLFDHSEFIMIREHGTSNYRTICSFNDAVFRYHIGNEDSTAGTPRNIRHYQSVINAPNTTDTGTIATTIGNGQTAGMNLEQVRLGQGNTNWTIFLTLFEDSTEFATDSYAVTIPTLQGAVSEQTTNIGFDNGVDPIKSVAIKHSYNYSYDGINNNFNGILSVSSDDLESNQALRVEVYYETPNASRSGSDLTFSFVNGENWYQNDYGIHKVAILFGRNQDSDLQLTVSIDGISTEVIDMRYPVADLDFSSIQIGCNPNFRGRVQNIQGVQFPNDTPGPYLPDERTLLDWVKNHDNKEDVLFNQFQRPTRHVETLNVTDNILLTNLVFRTPNGNSLYRLSIDNNGNLVTTLQ